MQPEGKKSLERLGTCNNLFLILLTCLSISGCVAVGDYPLEARAVASLQNKSLVASKRFKADFSAMVRERALVTAIPLVGPMIEVAFENPLFIEPGNALVKENGIEDPAFLIADLLGRLMEIRYGLNYESGGPATAIGRDDTPAKVTEYKRFQYVLDVSTRYWGFVYENRFSDNYRAFYVATLRLIEMSSENILAEGWCSTVNRLPHTWFSLDDLIGNGASRLKIEFENIAQFCVEEFSKKSLGM